MMSVLHFTTLYCAGAQSPQVSVKESEALLQVALQPASKGWDTTYCNFLWEYTGGIEDGKNNINDVLLPDAYESGCAPEVADEFLDPSSPYLDPTVTKYGTASVDLGAWRFYSIGRHRPRGISATAAWYVYTNGSSCKEFCEGNFPTGYCQAGVDDAHWQVEAIMEWSEDNITNEVPCMDMGQNHPDPKECTISPASSARSEAETQGKNIPGENGCLARWITQICQCGFNNP